MEVKDCSISNYHFKQTYTIKNHSDYFYFDSYYYSGFIFIQSAFPYEEYDITFEHLNLEVGNGFLEFSCTLCDYLALEVTKYFVSYNGL
mmetsp:Transcript_1075/g.1089  ORF Transcript_1075/g.1089 Transcript_1075/m.1089 type:complete len:89 (-) Transcript_1075:675-941(-)